MRIVDLSHTNESLPEDLPSFMRVEVAESDHAAGAVEMAGGDPLTAAEMEAGISAAGFTVACFPLKIKGASAGLTRAVAILPG